MKQPKPLSLAQKKALCGLPIDKPFSGQYSKFPWSTLSVLILYGYIEPVANWERQVRIETECKLSQSGIQMRAKLLAAKQKGES